MPEESSPTARNDRRIAWIVLALAAVALDICKHVWVFAAGPAHVVLDAQVYWMLGGLMAEGDWWLQQVDNAHRTPGYPAVIAIYRVALGDRALFGLIATQHLLCVLTSLLTGWICWRISGRVAVAAVGLLLCSLCLTRPWFACTVLTETLFTFLLTLHLACAIEYLHCRSRLMVVALALTLACSLLVRPVMLLWWLPLAAILVINGGRERRRQVLGDVVLMGAIVVLLVVPWVVRNQQVFGEPFFTRFTGRELWITTFPPDAGAFLPFPETDDMRELQQLAEAAGGEIDLRHNWTVSQLLQGAGVRDDDIDRRMQSIAWAAIQSDPARFAWFALKRGVNFWRCVVQEFPFFRWDGHLDVAGQSDWGVDAARISTARLLAWVPARSLWFNTISSGAALLGGILLILGRETRAYGLLLMALLLYVNGVTALLEIPNVRYRFVLEPAMMACGVCGWARLGRSATGRL